MSTPSGLSPLMWHFSELEDPRIDRGKKHLLTDIIAIVVCSILSGADDFEAMKDFADVREDWLRTFLELPNGIPSHDTLNRVFRKLDPQKFMQAFLAWTEDIAQLTDGEVVAIDGKVLRGSFDRAKAKAPIHLVSAWATENGVCLGQIKVDAKSNEIKALPQILELLDLKGCLITLDAMGCQREVAKKIVSKKADYTISLKGNQSEIFKDIKVLFGLISPEIKGQGPYQFLEQKNKGHGREEVRRYFVSDEIQEIQKIHDWPGLKSIGLVRRVRIIDGQASYADCYFLNSYSSDVDKFASAVRKHWHIENNLHWSLDVNFREDDCRVRKDRAPENLAIIRRHALNLLKRQPEKKSIRRKRARCAADVQYLSKVLTT